MKAIGKRILTGILAAAMIITQLPMGDVYAEEGSLSETALIEESGEEKKPDEDIGTGSGDGVEIAEKEMLADEENPAEAEKPEKSDELTEAEESAKSKEPAGMASSTEETTQAPETSGMASSTEETTQAQESAEMDEESETSSAAEDVGAADDELIWVTDELEGVYQFGDAPSKDSVGYSAEDFAAEADNGAFLGSVDEYIYQELLKRTAEIDIAGYKIPKDKLGAVVSGVLNEHPDLYFIDKTKLYSYSYSGNTVTSISLVYDSGLDDALFKRRVSEALAVADSYTTDLQKAIALHDYIAMNCEYDQENLDKEIAAQKAGQNTKFIPNTSYTAYGALAKRVAVCEGYALAYKYLLNQVGIDCLMVTSKKKNHAWNLIKLDGKYYHVDVTWDDPSWDLLGRVCHTYMFKSGAAFTGHADDWVMTRGSNVVNIQATDTTYDNAFWNAATSSLVLDGNYCYYAAFDMGAYPPQSNIYKAALSNLADKGDPVIGIAIWPVWQEVSRYYQTSYTGLFKYENLLYYNDKEKIYSINLDSRTSQTEYILKSTEEQEGYIYGIAPRDGKLKYVLHQSPGFKERETLKDSGVAIAESSSDIMATGITLNPSELSVIVGDSIGLTAKAIPVSATDNITWTSSDASIASVTGYDRYAEINAVKAGTCKITAATASGETAECKVTVNAERIPADSIKLNKTILALRVDGTATLTATVTPSNATDAVTWESSDSSVATVADGTVTAVEGGRCTITAKAGIQSATCEVTVEVPAQNITLDSAELELIVGRAAILTATATPDYTFDNVTWESSDPSVATVQDGFGFTLGGESRGMVTAVKEGTCTITAKVGNKSATCKVTVTAAVAPPRDIPAESITLDSDNTLELPLGYSSMLHATVTPNNTTDAVTWESSNDNIVKVSNNVIDSNGVNCCVIEAIAVGTCTITAKAGDKSAICTVTVTADAQGPQGPQAPGSEDKVTGVTLSKAVLVLKPQEKGTVKAAVTPPDLASQKVIWESSDTSIAAVEIANGDDKTAEITAKAEGVATITAKCGEKTASVLVRIVPADNEKIQDISGDIHIVGFKKESNDFVYTGKQITQDIRVYYKEMLLKEKTDYTIKYKNNVNVAAYDSAKAPSLTISLKGQYSGSVELNYTIKPKDINDDDIINIYRKGDDTPGKVLAVVYSNNLKIPAPELIFGKKLKEGTDFKREYDKELNAYKAGDDGICTVKGINNFDSDFKISFKVVDNKNKDFASASVKLNEKQYNYAGTPIAKTDVTIKEVKLGGTILDANNDYDYEVDTYGAYVLVYPTALGNANGYYGCKKVGIKLVGDREIKNAATDGTSWKTDIIFSQKTVDEKGGMLQDDQDAKGLLQFASDVLKEGTDYTVKYSNAAKVGRVTATFTGIGRYRGTLKKTYNIKPNNSITINEGYYVKQNNGKFTMLYQKGGAVPDFVLQDSNGIILKNNTDYTLRLASNKKPGEMTCTIKGKGNYNGYTDTVNVNVLKGDLNDAVMIVSDMPYSTRLNKWKSKVTIVDVNGKKLSAGKDYDAASIKYECDGADITNQEASPAAGQVISVTARGIGDYDGEASAITGSYRIYDKNISTLKVKIDNREYTGEAIELTADDIHVYANANDMRNNENELRNNEGNEIYEIVKGSYKNNIKAGTAKVTLRGRGTYGGEKTYTFKIVKKECYVLPDRQYEVPGGNYLTFEKKAVLADYTDEINKCIDKAIDEKYDGIYIPDGVYDIDAVKKIWIAGKNNFDFVMAPGAILRVVPTASANYSAIKIVGSSNIKVFGGTIIGERDKHLGIGGEGGEGITIHDSKDVTIDNVYISKCWGDGIYLGTDYHPVFNPNLKRSKNVNINIVNCVVYDNRRNNLSITVADGVTINNCEFNRANGTSPQSGIDIEPNAAERPCTNIKILNSKFKGNREASIAIAGYAGPVDKIMIENCTLDGKLSIWKVSDSKNKITIKNIKFEGGAGVWEG